MKDQFPLIFNPAEIGRSLKEVATDILRTENREVISRWFHSHKDADLFIWTDRQHNIIKQQLSCYGQVVEWNLLEGLKTGHVITDESPAMVNSSEILHFDQKLQRASLQQALAVVKHVPGLKAGEKEMLLRNFHEGQPRYLISAEEYLTRFADLVRKPGASLGKTSFIKRFVTVVEGWFTFKGR